MTIIDIRKDGSERLVAEGAAEVRYEPHDGRGKIPAKWRYSPLLIQYHTVASIKRDRADQAGIVLGPYRKPNPEEWVALGGDTRNKDYWEPDVDQVHT